MRHTLDMAYVDAATGDGRGKVHVLENGVAVYDPELGSVVERQVFDLLAREDMGRVEVRFRLCKDEADDVRFICKIDYPGDVEQKGGWRWWSPLLSTPGELRLALEEGLELRRLRHGLPRLEPHAPSPRPSPGRPWNGTSSRSLRRPAVARRSS
jgi:hypothetical protein